MDSPAALLRAWRQHSGWSQAEVADALHVSPATVSSWETGARRISLPLLQQLDAEYLAGGCLLDLVRALGTPLGFQAELRREGGRDPDSAPPERATRAMPHTYWGHLPSGASGPLWVWLRPGSGDRIRGMCYSGAVGVRLDEICGPRGIFLTASAMDCASPLHAVLAEPGWVDFGRGIPPAWLGARVKSFLQFRDLEFVKHHPRWMQFMTESLRRRDHGDPSTLRDRLAEVIGADDAERLTASYRRSAHEATSRPRATSRARVPPGMQVPPRPQVPGGPTRPRPPATPSERRALHRRLREARGLSQAEAAAALTALSGAAKPVSLHQVHNYESGRSKVQRLPQLPAMLDVIYGGWGWTCFEPVRLRRVAPGIVEAPFPPWWRGPVCVGVRPEAAGASDGAVTFAWPASALAHQDLEGEPRVFTFCRATDEPLRVQAPQGWAVQAHMGYDPDAIDANDDWAPATQIAGDRMFERMIDGWLAIVGKTRADLARALRNPGSSWHESRWESPS